MPRYQLKVCAGEGCCNISPYYLCDNCWKYVPRLVRKELRAAAEHDLGAGLTIPSALLERVSRVAVAHSAAGRGLLTPTALSARIVRAHESFKERVASEIRTAAASKKTNGQKVLGPEDVESGPRRLTSKRNNGSPSPVGGLTDVGRTPASFLAQIAHDPDSPADKARATVKRKRLSRSQEEAEAQAAGNQPEDEGTKEDLQPL